MHLCSAWARKKIYLETLWIFLLLLVNYAEAEINFIGLFKIGLDLHDLGKGLFGIVIAPITVIENSNAIPEHRILGVSQVDKGLLVGVISLLEVFSHEKTVTCGLDGLVSSMEVRFTGDGGFEKKAYQDCPKPRHCFCPYRQWCGRTQGPCQKPRDP